MFGVFFFGVYGFSHFLIISLTPSIPCALWSFIWFLDFHKQKLNHRLCTDSRSGRFLERQGPRISIFIQHTRFQPNTGRSCPLKTFLPTPPSELLNARPAGTPQPPAISVTPFPAILSNFFLLQHPWNFIFFSLSCTEQFWSFQLLLPSPAPGLSPCVPNHPMAHLRPLPCRHGHNKGSS